MACICICRPTQHPSMIVDWSLAQSSIFSWTKRRDCRGNNGRVTQRPDVNYTSNNYHKWLTHSFSHYVNSQCAKNKNVMILLTIVIPYES